MNGRAWRSINLEFTGLWSRRFASFAMKAVVTVRSTVTVSGSCVPPGAVSAAVTAPCTSAVAPTRSGVTSTRVLREVSSNGCANAASTAVVAASEVIPPTAVPAIVTPSGIVGASAGGASAGVATAGIAPPRVIPATTTDNRRRKRFTSFRLASDSWTVVMIPSAPASARPSAALDHDDRAVVGQLVVRELAAIRENGLGQVARREVPAGRNEGVEAFEAVQLTAAARLEHPVRVEDDGAAGLERSVELLVALARLDPEHQPRHVERADDTAGIDESRRRMPCPGSCNLAGRRIDEEVHHRDELPRSDLAD